MDGCLQRNRVLAAGCTPEKNLPLMVLWEAGMESQSEGLESATRAAQMSMAKLEDDTARESRFVPLTH